MRVLFHIGMGKTGTTAIQGALRSSAAALAAQDARYLGMWFEAVDPAFKGYAGLEAFASASREEQREHAAAFAEALRAMSEADGTRLFIHSNEGLFGPGRRLTPFFRTLSRQVDVSFVAYMRPVRSWLPSAFAQWGVRHKAAPGRIAGFGKAGRELIGQYAAARHWKETFGERLDLRLFDKGIDVVADFSEAAGVSLGAGKRMLERSEPAETLLRALYNDRFDEPVLPDQFNSAVMRPGAPPRRASEMARRVFDHSEIDAIISENAEIFDYIREKSGLDLLSGQGREDGPPDPEALRERLVDFLIEIVMQQSLRIRRLEREILKKD